MTIKTFATLPKPYKAYAKTILAMIKKPAKMEKVLPTAEYVVPALVIDRDHLKKYETVCGFKPNGTVPSTYLAVLSQALQMSMMTEEPFPFPLMGLVHIKNGLTQYRPIKDSETLRLSCICTNLAPHEKGLQFEFISKASVNGELVWDCVTTYLVRGKSTLAPSEKTEPKEKVVFTTADLHEAFSIDGGIGRRYAVVSGDVNPIHLTPLTAKLLGFKTTIAHGMWTMARCLSAMGTLPATYSMDVQFKLPVFLPAKVDFYAQRSPVAIFELNEQGSCKPHVAGFLTDLS